MQCINDSLKAIIKIEYAHTLEIEENSISKANAQIHITNYTTKLDCQINSQGLAQCMILSNSNKKIDISISMSKENIILQRSQLHN